MIIAIASGKGGTGKTFVSTNLFGYMQSMGEDVAFIDCDAEVPNACLFLHCDMQKSVTTNVFVPKIITERCNYCNMCAESCNFNAICCIPPAGYIKVIREICHGCRVCLRVCPNNAIEPAFIAAGKVTSYGRKGKTLITESKVNIKQKSPVPVIRHAIEEATKSPARYTIIDAPPGCSCPFVNSVIKADKIILVAEPTPFGLNDLKLSIEVVRSLKKKFAVVINRSTIGDGKMKDYLSGEGIDILAEIPYSEEIASNYANGKLSFENKEIKNIFKHLYNRIITS